MDTNMAAFTNSCAGYVHTYIIGPIVTHLASKGIQVTIDELAGVLQLPARAVAPAVPAMAFGGAVPTMAPAIAPTTTRKTTVTASPVAGRTCMYQLKRGENKGKYCGKTTAPGSDFCANCLKTRKCLAKDLAAGTIPGAVPGVIPGMPGIPAGYAPPVPGNTTAGGQQAGQLSVLPYDEARGLFREPTHNFIVYEVSPGVVSVIGRLSETENKITPLTPQEQTTALQLGLTLGEGATANRPTAAPVPTIPMPTITAPVPMPTVPVLAIPAIPTGPTGAHPVIITPAIPTGTIIHPTTITPTGHPPLPTIPPITPVTAAPAVPIIPQIHM